MGIKSKHKHPRLLLSVSPSIETQFQRAAEKKAPVPKKDEKPIMGLVSDKNFIVANAVENILAGKHNFH